MLSRYLSLDLELIFEQVDVPTLHVHVIDQVAPFLGLMCFISRLTKRQEMFAISFIK